MLIILSLLQSISQTTSNTMDTVNANIQNFIEGVFSRYDPNGTGTLNVSQLHSFMNEIFFLSGQGRTATNEEVQSTFRGLDRNQDGQIDKSELFESLKWMTNTHYRPQQTGQRVNSYQPVNNWGNSNTQSRIEPQPMLNTCPSRPMRNNKVNDPTWDINYTNPNK